MVITRACDVSALAAGGLFSFVGENGLDTQARDLLGLSRERFRIVLSYGCVRMGLRFWGWGGLQ